MWQNDWIDDEIRALVGQKRATEEQVEDFLWRRNSSDEEFERQLDEWFPAGILVPDAEILGGRHATTTRSSRWWE
jgi:hypothetical protein